MPSGDRCRRFPYRVRRRHGPQADPPRARTGRAVLSEWDGGALWYAGYGSNLLTERFRCYLHGGCPPGATRTYPGSREPADPLDTRAFTMPGRVAFAWESPTWGGGIAFYEPGGEDVALARAYLITARQFADVLHQEMRREPGADIDLAPVLQHGLHTLGPGRYETLHLAGQLDGRPVVTFSTPDVDQLGIRAPADAYVATMARGLRDTHELSDGALVDYLATCRGIGRSRETLAGLLVDHGV